MYNILIVDDETIVRSSLASILDWESQGFNIIGSAANGQAALKIIQSQSVDILLTDIKMPIMDGIRLIENINEMEGKMLGRKPVIIVLSAYNEFDLVRQAFRLGAHDYILKSDITAAYITDLLNSVKHSLLPDVKNEPLNKHLSKSDILKHMALGEMLGSEEILPDEWCLACMEIDNFKNVSIRFGKDLETSLVKPMLDFAQQIPRVAAKCIITAISFSRFVILFPAPDAIKQAQSICLQLQKVWKDYMNLSTTGGISRHGKNIQEFFPLLQNCYDNITLKFIFGSGGIFTPEEERLFNVKKAVARLKQLGPLFEGIRSMSAQQLIDAQQPLFVEMYRGTLDNAKTIALEIIYNLEMQLLDAGADLWAAFNPVYGTDFYQEVQRLATTRDVELLVGSIIRWMREYLCNTQVSSEINIIEKAKHFIADHYTDPELHLSAVANYVGLNEKYFSSRFNKETGKSFVNYLTELRVSRAKQLILKTDMKMYEISDAAGFTSVEHFTRIFKKYTKTSPNKYHGSV